VPETILRGKGWEALYKHLSFHPVPHFSTSRSNGTNKVIDTQGIFLLSSPVYIEAHPRRIAAHGDLASSLRSFNPFSFNSFRTLSHQWRSPNPLPSIVCGLFPSQWGCIPPLLYPAFPEFRGERSPRRFTQSAFGEGAHFHRLPLLQSALFPAVPPISLQALIKCSSRNSFVLTTIHFHGGCIPPFATRHSPLATALLVSCPQFFSRFGTTGTNTALRHS
jgi:hypothetical protein